MSSPIGRGSLIAEAGPQGYHVKLAIWYFIVGLIVIPLKGIVTERITAFMARRQGVEL